MSLSASVTYTIRTEAQIYQPCLGLLLLVGLQDGGGVDQWHLIRSLPPLQHVL